MSLKYAVEKAGDNHYVLPRTGSMRVEAHAFLSEALYELSEESLWQQIVNAASHEAAPSASCPPCTTRSTRRCAT